MLILDGVRKSFYDPGRGEVRAVDGVDLQFNDGVTAIMGANGAGKSTLLRLIATLLIPDAGRVLVDGIDTTIDADAVRRRMGYLSTSTKLYQRLTTREMLVHVGGFYGLTAAQLTERISVQNRLFQLDAFLEQRLEGLSTGQMQRVNLARTLLADPPLLILDEPTTGLDVLAAAQVVESVQQARRPGRLVLYCTHVPAEVEATADRLVLIRDGRVAWDGIPRDLGSGDAFAAAVRTLLAPSC